MKRIIPSRLYRARAADLAALWGVLWLILGGNL
jgi:hypothetical protein